MRRTNFVIAVASLFLWAFISLSSTVGCARRPSLIPNSDPALRKTSAEFSSDAANRHPYKLDASRAGTATGSAIVDYQLNTVQVVNLSEQEWRDIEIWVNQKYVCYVPRIESGRGVRTLNFEMFFDGRGNHLPIRWETSQPQVQKVDLLRDGMMYDLPIRLAE